MRMMIFRAKKQRDEYEEAFSKAFRFFAMIKNSLFN
jgi:hypothetical protein